MNKRKQENRMLDEIGRKLLETSSLRVDEIEEIVSAPRLFDDIKARIRSEQASNAKKAAVQRPVFSFWTWQYGGAVFASLAVLVLAVAGLSVYVGRTPSTTNGATASGAIASGEAVSEAPAEGRPIPASITAPKTGGDEIAPEFKPTHLVFRDDNKNKSVLKAEFGRPRQVQKPRAEIESEQEFYPLAFTGNAEEIASGARVVRVDLPRSSLFAMGIDLPVEAGPDTIKTDLLISSDGVTRGFRFVDK